MLILLVTSPRVAPGLLTLQAWDALREAARVLAPPDHPQHAALVAAGIDVDLLHVSEGELAPRLAARRRLARRLARWLGTWCCW